MKNDNSETMQEHAQMVSDCEAREGRLDDWQRKFIDSLGRQLAQGVRLTAKQSEALDDVWELATAKG